MNAVQRRGARVLVVDDNDDDIELLRVSFLRHASSCTLLGACSSSAAQAALADAANRPDLLLLDWKMPGMNTPDLIRAIRRNPRLVGLAVIVFSSSDDPSDVRAAYDAGATGYMLKPPSLDEYEEFVKDITAFWCRPMLYP